MNPHQIRTSELNSLKMVIEYGEIVLENGSDLNEL